MGGMWVRLNGAQQIVCGALACKGQLLLSGYLKVQKAEKNFSFSVQVMQKHQECRIIFVILISQK
jgi:hypothetical protein